MYKFFIIILMLSGGFAGAQDKKTTDSIDKVIITRFIAPAEEKAGMQEPAWAALREQIRSDYLDVEADRAITRAQIYYYFNHQNWPQFSTAITHYTEAYASKENLKLMNRNANLILEHSTNREELKMALSWISHAMIKDPANAEYKTTFEALSEKVNTQQNE